MIAVSVQMWINLGTSVLAGIIVTVAVLLTGILFNHIRDALPAGCLFNGIKSGSEPCLVFIRRMKDKEKSDEFITPIPDYLKFNTRNARDFEKCQLIPWVTSVPTAQSLAFVLNVLGRIGCTNNIELISADEGYDRWDVPMIIIGGSWKSRRALETCQPYFRLQTNGFALCPTGDTFPPRSRDEDMGLLQKMINPTNQKPVWLVMGLRGEATVSASYALVRYWRYLGWIYKKKPFGLLVACNDKDGWQQFHIVSLFPKPSWFTKLRHPYAWHNLKNKIQKRR